MLFFRYFPKLALIASLLLFALSLANDAYSTSYDAGSGGHPGVFLLLLGWLGIAWGGTLAWLANPALGVAWAFFIRKRHGYSGAAAAVALLLMLSFLFQDTVIASEAPTYAQITGYSSGYWLWVASAVALLLANAVAGMPTDFLTTPDRAP